MKKHTKQARFVRTKYAYVDLAVLIPEDAYVPLNINQKFQKELKRFKKLTTQDIKNLNAQWESFSEDTKRKVLSEMKKL